jgi:hypothetical protein
MPSLEDSSKATHLNIRIFIEEEGFSEEKVNALSSFPLN